MSTQQAVTEKRKCPNCKCNLKRSSAGGFPMTVQDKSRTLKRKVKQPDGTEIEEEYHPTRKISGHVVIYTCRRCHYTESRDKPEKAQ